MGNKCINTEPEPVRADFKTTLEWCEALEIWLTKNAPKPTQEEFEAAVKKFEEEKEYEKTWNY